MLDIALSFIFSNLWTISFLLVALYNYYFRPEHKPVIHVALITAGIFAVSHITYIQWIAPHPELVKIHYVYLASSAALLASTIFVYTKWKGFIFHWPIKLTIALMLIEVTLDVLLHIDRNIMALNGAELPNTTREHAWWLWSVRNAFFTMDNVVILISLVLPVGILSKRHPITETDAGNVYILNTSEHPRIVQLSSKSGFRNLHSEQYIKEIDNAYARVENIQDLIDAMPQGEAKNTASQFAYTASELITRQDQSKMDFMKSITLLCDNARDYAIYVEKRKEAELLKMPEKTQEQAS